MAYPIHLPSFKQIQTKRIRRLQQGELSKSHIAPNAASINTAIISNNYLDG